MLTSSDAPKEMPSCSTASNRATNLFNATYHMLEECYRLRIPFFKENPTGNYMWKMPRARRMQPRPGIVDVATHYCGFGTPWKPTTFRCFGISRAEKLVKT